MSRPRKNQPKKPGKNQPPEPTTGLTKQLATQALAAALEAAHAQAEPEQRLTESDAGCPFCKSICQTLCRERETDVQGQPITYSFVFCWDCGATGPEAVTPPDRPEKAIELWNTRA
jgi:hypothetical protein